MFVSGATSSMLVWREEFCRELADQGRHVIRFDNRDTGQSSNFPLGRPGYTLQDLADDVVGLIDALGLGSAHLAGMSMGGMIAQLATLAHSDRVRTLTLMMTSPDPSAVSMLSDEPSASALPGPWPAVVAGMADRMMLDRADPEATLDAVITMNRILAGTRHPYDETADRALRGSEIERARCYANTANHSRVVGAAPSWRHRLGEITTPTLVIHGTEDPILPYPHGVALASEILGAKLVTLEGVGHEIPRSVLFEMIPSIVEHTAG
ncbi:MAG: alpha/beta hydrolase [Ilumatobacteraceae bacterium]